MDTYKIVWNDTLNVGSELIDSQHKKLIELIGGIPEHETQRDEAMLNEALEYIATHFSEEEDFMAEINYPELGRHKNKHKRLVRILMAYKKKYDGGDKDLYPFKQFMFRWVRDHIMDEDKKIGLFIQSSGHIQPSKAIDGD